MKVAVVSGKGGSGKSTITAALVGLTPSVVAVDCDVDASNLPLLFEHQVLETRPFASGCHIEMDAERCVRCGLCAETCVFQAISITPKGLPVFNSFMCEGCGLCCTRCPQKALRLIQDAGSSLYRSRFARGVLVHGNLKPGDDNSGRLIAQLRTVADEQMDLQKIDWQILDGPPGIGCPVMSTLTGTDCALIVAEPTLSGLADLQRIYRVCLSFCRYIVLIINKFDINLEHTNSIRNFCRGHQIPILAEIPFTRMMVDSMLSRSTIIDYAPNSDVADTLRRAHAQLQHHLDRNKS